MNAEVSEDDARRQDDPAPVVASGGPSGLQLQSGHRRGFIFCPCISQRSMHFWWNLWQQLRTLMVSPTAMLSKHSVHSQGSYGSSAT
eukprot:657975-Pleurochrysis_carterae.AAC.6